MTLSNILIAISSFQQYFLDIICSNKKTDGLETGVEFVATVFSHSTCVVSVWNLHELRLCDACVISVMLYYSKQPYADSRRIGDAKIYKKRPKLLSIVLATSLVKLQWENCFLNQASVFTGTDVISRKWRFSMTVV